MGSHLLPDIILVEKDCWISGEDSGLNVRLLDWKPNGHVFKLPKLILLATNISNDEGDKAGPTRGKLGKLYPMDLVSVRCGKKTLVVDDNSVNRMVATGSLKKFGASVEYAASAKDALEKLQIPHCFDACCMDIQMPEMDGFQATRLIRQKESKANELMINGGSSVNGAAQKVELHLPVLAVTADVIHATFDECLKCGMDGYISKPFEEENLYQELARFFKSKPLAGA